MMAKRWSTFVVGAALVAGGLAVALPAADARVPVRGTFTPVDPVRVLDTRDGTGVADQHVGPLGAGQVTELVVLGVGGVPEEHAAAVVLNVTVTEAAGPGYVTVYPCGAPRPLASNLNFQRGVNVPNQVTVKVGDEGRVCFFAFAQTHLVADLFGWYADDYAAVPGFHYHEVDPARLLDTRDGTGLGERPAGPLAPDEVLALDVSGIAGEPTSWPPSTTVKAVVLNVTAADAAAPGYVTVFPCDKPRPLASNLNVDPSAPAVANLVTVRVPESGQVCFVANVATHLIADVQGYFSATPGATFTPTTPVRVLDTRDGTGVGDHRTGPLGAAQVFELPIRGVAGVPDDARAVLLNVTITEARGPGFITVYPCGRPRPWASNLNFVRGVDRANLVKARIGANGSVCFFAFEGTQIVADLQGWYTPIDAG